MPANWKLSIRAPDGPYLLGYQRIPEEELLDIEEVSLAISIKKLLSKDGYRVNCELCSEEIINEREVMRNGVTMCRPYAGQKYYQPVSKAIALSLIDALHGSSRQTVR